MEQQRHLKTAQQQPQEEELEEIQHGPLPVEQLQVQIRDDQGCILLGFWLYVEKIVLFPEFGLVIQMGKFHSE